MALSIVDILQDIESTCAAAGTGYETHIVRDMRGLFFDRGRFPRVFVQFVNINLLNTDKDDYGLATYQVTVWDKSVRDVYGSDALIKTLRHADILHDALSEYIYTETRGDGTTHPIQGRIDGYAIQEPFSVDRASKVWIQGASMMIRILHQITV